MHFHRMRIRNELAAFKKKFPEPFNHAGESDKLKVKEKEISGKVGMIHIIKVIDRSSRTRHNSCEPRWLLNDSEYLSLGK